MIGSSEEKEGQTDRQIGSDFPLSHLENLGEMVGREKGSLF